MDWLLHAVLVVVILSCSEERRAWAQRLIEMTISTEMQVHLKCIESGTIDEKISSARWLGENRAHTAIPSLIRSLRGRWPSFWPVYGRTQGEWAYPASICDWISEHPFGFSGQMEGHRPLRHPNCAVRAWSAWALGEIGDRSVVIDLIASLEIEEQEPAGSLKTISDYASPDIVRALEKITGEHFGFDVTQWRKYRNNIRTGKR